MKKSIFPIIFIFFLSVKAQRTFTEGNLFKTDCFIENNGQYNRFNDENKPIIAGVDNGKDHFYFHASGFRMHFKKLVLSDSMMREMSNLKLYSTRDYLQFARKEESILNLDWIGVSPNSTILKEDKVNHYFSYGDAPYQSNGYKKIVYKDIYPYIDAIYQIGTNGGIKYSLILHPGADLRNVQFRYTGEGWNVKVERDQIELQHFLEQITENGLLVYDHEGRKIPMHYARHIDGSIGIESEESLDNSKVITIDPWVGTTSALTATKGKGRYMGTQVDYDLFGNLFVYGGGELDGFIPFNPQNQYVAKYDKAGNHIWTFMGSVPSVNWESSFIAGNSSDIEVFKESGKVLIGQGYVNFQYGGSRCIRINQNGIYDNYVTVMDSAFNLISRIERDCKLNRISLMGLSNTTGYNLCIAQLDGSLVFKNFTGFFGTFNDQFQIVFDCTKNKSNEIYTINWAGNVPSIKSRLYKLNAALNGSLWNNPCGYNTLDNRDNRPSIEFGASTEFNALSANKNHLFYYDGYNLKAFNTMTGSAVGSPRVLTGYTPKYQGGIATDECNNVYLGGNNGNIKVFNFDGTNFVAKPDILIAGKAGRKVFDVKYSETHQLLFVAGDSLIATLIPSQICGYNDTLIQTTLIIGCNKDAYLSLNNPDTTEAYSYQWFDSTANVLVRNIDNVNKYKDTSTNLQGGHVYELKVLKGPMCEIGSKILRFKYDSCATVQNISICQGKVFLFNNHSYSVAGNYSDTLKTAMNKDSIVNTLLTVKPISTFSQTAAICQGKGYNFNSKTYNLTGIYKDTFVNYLGCDSIVTTALTVNPISQTNLSPTICEGSTFTNNSKVYAIAGIYRDTLINFRGCDSILSITLNVLPKTYPTIFKTICKNQTLMVGSKSYSTSGIYRDTLLNYLGCDSILTHNLTVLPISTHSQQVSLCDGKTYKVGNSTYSKAGVYVDTLVSYRGCDSIETTVISIKNISQSNLKKEICQGEVYAFRSKILQSTGKYIDTLSNQYGCDSIITLDLLVKPVPILSLKKGLSLCEALQDTIQLDAGVYTSYLWMPDGQKTQQITITKAGVYSLEVLNDQGCKAKDSTKVLEVCKPVLFVPNAFSPNGDGRNDAFKVYGAFIKQIHWMVFNRLGELIREGRSMDDIWDGFYHGEPAPNGVYVYTVEAEGQNGDKLEEKGSLTIIR